MRNLENVLLAWTSVTTFGMFVAVAGMHKLDFWDAQMAIYIVLASIVGGMLAGVQVAKKQGYITLENGNLFPVPELTEEEKKQVETDLDAFLDSLE